MTGPVVLTRPSRSALPLRQALAAQGLDVLDWPGIELVAELPDSGLEGLIAALSVADAVAFPSPGAVAAAHGFLGDLGQALEAPGRRIYAQGKGTEAALAQAGCGAILVPPQSHAEDLADLIATTQAKNSQVLVLSGSLSSGVLDQALAQQGLQVRTLTLYTNRPPANLERPEQPVACAVFASPSAARNHLHANPWLRAVPAVAIGDTTGTWLKHDGAHTHVVVAAQPTLNALLDAVLATVKGSSA
jgi:uroporphyrinogen-III synthase